ncbi:MAG: alpha/beta fold hydrolase [Bryobacteraceae bacterium]|jgi:dipeptidyl aminopeptidase/acylaminoacyl peptidase
MRVFVFVALLSAFIITMTATQADDLAGGWKGTWTKDGDALPVTVTFAKTGDAYSGAFDSDVLQVAGIPLGDVGDTNGRVHFQIKGDQSTTVFDGAITGEAMSGTFTDGSGKGSFELARTALPATQIRTRDVTFQDKDVTLAGTLLLPTTPGKHPAIVFLHGSGPEGRWANHYLAQKFAEGGIVALIYDKRGVGQSTGDWQKATFEALADDAAAGIRLLQSQSEVDPTRVGIYGHSQGGTIAPLVGVRGGDLRFVIASAAGGIDPADVEIYSVENFIGLAKLPPAERADAQSYVHALIDVAYHGTDHAPLDAMAAKFKNREWYFAPPPPDNSYWLISKQMAAFKPAEYWRQIKAPVLLVYGAHDERVPPRESANAIQAALKSGGNKNVTLKTYSNADHTFTIVDPPHKGGWPRHEPEYTDMLVNWILAQQ